MMAGYDAVKGICGACRYTAIGFGPTLLELIDRHPQGARWVRRQAQSGWEIIRDAFQDWHTRTFMLWMTFMTMQPPDRPGTGWLAYSIPYGRQAHSWTMPKGGSTALPQALARCIEAHGGVVLTRKPVARLLIEGGRCVGVETEDGAAYRARHAVLSTIHIKHLVEMAPKEAWGEEFLAGVGSWQAGVSMFVTHYASTVPPQFPAGQGTITSVAAGIPGSVDRMVRVGNELHRGIDARDDPVLLVVGPTVAHPSRAPAGRHTLKVIGFQPYELPEGPAHWDEIEAGVSAANLAQLRRYAPNVTDATILGSRIESPLGLERLNRHNWHGSCHGGGMRAPPAGPPRPGPGGGAARAAAPRRPLTPAPPPPGGSVSAAPGRNAAMVLLRDLGTSLEAAIGDA